MAHFGAWWRRTTSTASNDMSQAPTPLRSLSPVHEADLPPVREGIDEAPWMYMLPEGGEQEAPWHLPDQDTEASQAPTRVPSAAGQGEQAAGHDEQAGIPEQLVMPKPKRPRPSIPPSAWTEPGPPPAYAQRPSTDRPQPKQASRLSSADYQAIDIHGFFGLVDCGDDGRGCRVLKAHLTRRAHLPTLEILAGQVIPVLSTRRKGVRASLRVQYVSRSQYYSPGAKVSTLNVGVSAQDWALLSTS